MSSIVNKVKEALHSDKSDTHHNTSTTHNTSSGAPEGEYGPHGSRVANAADPRVDSDRDGSHNTGRTAGHGEYGSSTGGYVHGTGPTHASHDTGLGASTGSAGFGQHNSGTREGEHGPHSSRIANAADPRVDSDRDGSHNVGRTAGQHENYGSSTGGYVHGTGPTHASHTTGLGASTGSAGFGNTSGTREGEHGPHSSRIANAADPRVDSDRDGSRNAGAAYGTSTTGHGTGNTFGSSTHTGTSGFTTGSNAGTREGEHGPHSSRTANALDPRVDSDRDGSRNAGAAYGSTGTGNTFGSSTHTGNQGFGTGHNTGAGYGSSTGYDNASGLGHTGPGPAPNTAGPHKSDMVNKLDPRVDSDLDGSKTVGGNKTYQ
ncbi:hypothetical protein CONLIGDRAFT_637679 [Coniochaeta ligniaria NRRL 30616]|uniref:Cell surface protein n=1 Tax=Coniochaeta ligniaria NRRL 30616 TaxID=1408157 RepID=A0A1J7IRI5_9PEZI|nr:hypothetical protein CONLIGDRAFT_637679 [Coniochaeta ligniaria NRRL 30616]